MLASLLITLFSTACATNSPKLVKPFRCSEPELRGDTWADVAVLAIEQRDALRECNLKNGHPPKANATMPKRVAQATPEACREVGVRVEDGMHATGQIYKSFHHEKGKAQEVCESGNVGCAIYLGQHRYEIHYESSEDDWVWLHERCHALYEAPHHTLEYLISRAGVR